jgi:transcriptional regulator with XRE-family HTH domain
VPAVDPVTEVARQFAENVRAAIGVKSLRQIGIDTGVHHTTIIKLLNGESWPDLETIAKLEIGLGVSLWPGPPRP